MTARDVKFLDPDKWEWRYSKAKEGVYAFYALDSLLKSSMSPMVVVRKGEEIIRLHNFGHKIIDFQIESTKVEEVLDLCELDVLFNAKLE